MTDAGHCPFCAFKPGGCGPGLQRHPTSVWRRGPACSRRALSQAPRHPTPWAAPLEPRPPQHHQHRHHQHHHNTVTPPAPRRLRRRLTADISTVTLSGSSSACPARVGENTPHQLQRRRPPSSCAGVRGEGPARVVRLGARAGGYGAGRSSRGRELAPKRGLSAASRQGALWWRRRRRRSAGPPVPQDKGTADCPRAGCTASQAARHQTGWSPSVAISRLCRGRTRAPSSR